MVEPPQETDAANCFKLDNNLPFVSFETGRKKLILEYCIIILDNISRHGNGPRLENGNGPCLTNTEKTGDRKSGRNKDAEEEDC